MIVRCLFWPCSCCCKDLCSIHYHSDSYFQIFFFQILADREVQRILLELLNQMDGFDQTVNVKVCYEKPSKLIGIFVP